MIKSTENIKKEIQLVVDIYKSADFTKAELLCKKIIENYPKNAFLYNLLGLIFSGQQKANEAIACYERCINLDPKFAMAYNNLGLIFFNNKSDYIGAENNYKKSISADSKIAEPHNNLGNLYNALDKFQEAIDCYKKAIELNPKIAQFHHNIGNSYITLGSFGKAKDHYKRAIELNPFFTDSHRSLSRLIKYSQTENHFKLLKDINKKINSNDLINKSNISFALGKAYEDINDFENSYKSYYEANNCYRKKINFSINNEQKKFKEIKKIFEKDFYKKFKNLESTDKSSIFILGMPRSGTTLVEQILSNHPKVFGADEVEYFPQLIKKEFQIDDLDQLFNKINIINSNSLKNIADKYLYTMKSLSKNSEKFTDKFPANFLLIGFIRIVFPNSKIIHCIRDPRDNCLSIFKNHFPGGKIKFAYKFAEIISYYNLYSDLMKFWNNLFPNFIYNIKYENLITNSKFEIENLLKYTNLTWSDKCINFYTNKKPIKTASDVQARSKLFKSSISSWKNFEKYLVKDFAKLKN